MTTIKRRLGTDTIPFVRDHKLEAIIKDAILDQVTLPRIRSQPIKRCPNKLHSNPFIAGVTCPECHKKL
jgi:hypothetical protein